MKKLALFGICATLLVGLGASSLSQAAPFPHGGGGGFHGGGPGGGFHGGGYHGGGYHGHGGHWGWGGNVFVGVGPYWGPDPYYWGPAPYYAPPPVVYVTPPAPQVYVEKQAPSASYYCHNPVGYYPQVPRCPTGWQKLAPR